MRSFPVGSAHNQLMRTKLKASICLRKTAARAGLESEFKVKPAGKHHLSCGRPVKSSERCERGVNVHVGWNSLFQLVVVSLCERHTPGAPFPARVRDCSCLLCVLCPPYDTQHIFVPGLILRTGLFSGCEPGWLNGSQPLRSES